MFVLFIIGSSFVSAICCEKVKNSEMWCQSAASTNECDSKYTIWAYKETCSTVPECSGTCVNSDTGECSQNTPKAQCLESKGSWSEKDIDEVDACQEICCLIGQDAWFINQKECKNLFEEHNIQGVMRNDITSREGCEALQSRIVTGACVISDSTEKACIISKNTDCTTGNINELSRNLKNPSSAGELNVKFYEGLLCTASLNGVGISDCVKSKETVCEDNKVYYTDLCGNLANVYDSGKYDDVNYWNYIQDPYTSDEVCTVDSSGSNTCGNCNTAENTVCQNYKDAGTTRPAQGEFVCGDLSCRYKGKTYEHGESWCEGTVGTLLIERNLTTGEMFLSDINKLKNSSKYSIPGSRYYKLVCSFGEVLVEECGDYRNSVCIQGKNDDSKRSEASCVYNPWRTCLQVESKTACESNTSLCRWIPGYRWDLQVVAEEDRKEYQGSCVPLIAPGFDFWEATSQGNVICEAGTVQESALFETPIIGYQRKNMDEWEDKTLANRCLDGCYALPYYGMEFKFNGTKVYPEDVTCTKERDLGQTGCKNLYAVLTAFYDDSGFHLNSGVGSYHLSERLGQYCHKKNKPDQWLTGKVDKEYYDCTPGFGGQEKEEEKERDYPIYLTNEEWLWAITERARSLGDCGYKPNIEGEYSDPETEIITAIFQKLKQDGSIKKNITVEQIIYKGNKYLEDENLEKYETESAYSTTTEYTGNCADVGGFCTSTAYNPEPCSEGGTIPEGTCPQNMVCCVYTELS